MAITNRRGSRRWRPHFGTDAVAEAMQELQQAAQLYGQPVRFTPDAPPPGWERQHQILERLTMFTKGRSREQVRRNQPVPRQANCHYLRPDPDGRNFYFY